MLETAIIYQDFPKMSQPTSELPDSPMTLNVPFRLISRQKGA